jgi:apolipoprotein N-acyltransferase
VTGRRAPSLLLACGVAFVAGLGTSLAFPPAALWPLAFLGLVPMLVVFRGRSVPQGALLGLCFGVGLFGASLYWIALFGELAWTALVLLSAASIAAFGAVAVLLQRDDRPVRTALALAAAWTVIDWVRGMWPLGGFTWTALGTSQVGDRWLLPLASVTGIWGITFVVVFANVAVTAACLRWGRGVARAGLATAALAGVVAPSLLPATEATGDPVSIAVVQIDVRVPADVSPVEEDRIVAQRTIDEHRSLAGAPDPPDLPPGLPPGLVVWGEGALDPGALADPTTTADVRRAIMAVGAPTLAGAVVNDPDGSQHTSALAFDGTGTLVDRYDKVHLVPFGEYVPWRSRLSWIGAISQIPVDRVPGERVHTITQPGLPPYGTPICFENAFPAIPRALVRDGATFLVVPVNNASYGFTAAAAQHLQMSQMRAVETGRWVVDAGVAGISAFIDPDGAVTAHTELFQSTILRGDVRPSTDETLYVRFGDWVPIASMVLVGSTFLTPRRRPIARPAPPPLAGSVRALAILPTYEERDTIETVIRGVLETPGVDVLVVDDSSPDGTGDVVRAIAATEPRVRLTERPAKSGLASAYLEGFRAALTGAYDLAIEMDSDLSHDPQELPVLLAAAGTHDLVVGSRYVSGGSVTNWSRARVLLSRTGNTYARFMLGLPIHDATSGYRVYRHDLLEDLLRRPFAAEGYGFQIELVLRAHRLGYDVAEAPITFREREFGESKISRSIVAEALWMVTRWGLQLRLRTRPTL